MDHSKHKWALSLGLCLQDRKMSLPFISPALETILSIICFPKPNMSLTQHSSVNHAENKTTCSNTLGIQQDPSKENLRGPSNTLCVIRVQYQHISYMRTKPKVQCSCYPEINPNCTHFKGFNLKGGHLGILIFLTFKVHRLKQLLTATIRFC